MSEKYWFLKSCELFERLADEEIAQLEAASQTRSFERGSLIYLPTDRSNAVLLLTSGRVKLYHITSAGKEALLTFIDPGEIFGELAVFESGEREDFAEAMEKSSVILIPREFLQQTMENHSHLALGVTKLMGLRRRRIERRLKSLLFRSNRERLIHLLLELAEKYGSRTTDGVKLEIKLSHQELANVIGSTRETVTVLLGELQNERKITIKRRQIFIDNLAQLAASIDVQPPALASEKDPKQPVTQPGYR